MHVGEVGGIGIEYKVRSELLLLDCDQTHPEMIEPASIRRRSGIEQNRRTNLFDQWLVTMSEENAIDLTRKLPNRLIAGRTTTMTVNQTKSKSADGDRDCRRQHILKFRIIVVAGHRDQRCRFGKLLEHRSGVGIAKMDDQPYICPVKEIEDLWWQSSRRRRIDVRISNHTNCERWIEQPLP